MPDTIGKADAKRPGGPLVLAFCRSDFRRRFYYIAKAGNAPIASEALHRIGLRKREFPKASLPSMPRHAA